MPLAVRLAIEIHVFTIQPFDIILRLHCMIEMRFGCCHADGGGWFVRNASAGRFTRPSFSPQALISLNSGLRPRIIASSNVRNHSELRYRYRPRYWVSGRTSWLALTHGRAANKVFPPYYCTLLPLVRGHFVGHRRRCLFQD